MRRLALASAAAALAALAACGSPAADLFSLEREGKGAGARLTLVVSDAGTVRCNGAAPRPLPAEQLLQARELARDAAEQAELNLELPPGPARGTTFTYRAELAAGSVAWADSSRDLPPSLVGLAAFARTVAKGICELPR